MNFDGKVLMTETRSVNVAPLASQVVFTWPLEKLADAGVTDSSKVFAVADLTANGSEISRNLIYLTPVKEVHLKPAVLDVKASQAGGIITIRVTSPVLARSVYVSFGDLDVTLSDNYFDLLPRGYGRDPGQHIQLARRTQLKAEKQSP